MSYDYVSSKGFETCDLFIEIMELIVKRSNVKNLDYDINMCSLCSDYDMDSKDCYNRRKGIFE